MRRVHVLAVAAGTALLAACSESPLETHCCTVLTRVEMSAETATVPVGQTLTFSATVFDEANQPVQTDIAWQVATAARGSITTAGVFTANSPGTTYVRAVVGTLRDSALVTVTAAP